MVDQCDMPMDADKEVIDEGEERVVSDPNIKGILDENKGCDLGKEVQETMEFGRGSGLVMEKVMSEVEKMIQGEGSTKMLT